MELPKRRTIRLAPAVYSEAGRAFSATVGTFPRTGIFLDIDFGLACVRLLSELSARRQNRVFAYCLMPDHVHLLVESRADSPLSSFVGAWKSRCYRERRRRGNGQPFWQRSFYDHALRAEEDLHAAALYILSNPVRRGFVEDFHDYPLCGSFVFDL
ncbi:MAG TPA: transposase [Thermoanaerobaculaceae bacterium]|nr:transposase [Thermoanaerobaculaceae bacterium]